MKPLVRLATLYAFAALPALACAQGAAPAAGQSAAQAQAQTYSNKPLKIVVPFFAGSDLDPVARGLGDHFTATWGQHYVVENKGGANGQIGTGYVAKSTPDGHTLLICSPGPITINPNLQSNLPYTVGKDIVPVSLIATAPMVLVASARVPARNYAEFATYLKTHPGKAFFASAGVGNVTHLAAELFLRQAGLSAVHTPYKGAQSVIADLLGGHVDFYFNPLPSARTYIKDHPDKVRALAVTSLERSPHLPDVPTLNELGLKGFDVNSWYGLCAPGGTPQPVITKLNGETTRALSGGELPGRLRGFGMSPQATTPEQFDEHIRKESAQWAAIIKEKNIKPE